MTRAVLKTSDIITKAFKELSMGHEKSHEKRGKNETNFIICRR